MNEPMDTENLHLRPFDSADARAWHAIWGDPEVIWWGPNAQFERSQKALERLLAQEAKWPRGIGWLAITLPASGEIIGDVLLQPARFVEGIEIGWHVRKPHWNRGHATEAARAVLQRGFAQGAMAHAHAIVALQNAPSLRVVAKLGFTAQRDLEYEGLPHRIFVAAPDRG